MSESISIDRMLKLFFQAAKPNFSIDKVIIDFNNYGADSDDGANYSANAFNMHDYPPGIVMCGLIGSCYSRWANFLLGHSNHVFE